MSMNLLGAIGGKPCEKVLEQILQEENDPKLVSKVMRLIFHFKEGLKSLEEIKDRRHFAALSDCWLHSHMNSANGMKTENKVLISHLRCCISAYYRSHMGKAKEVKRMNPAEMDKSNYDRFI